MSLRRRRFHANQCIKQRLIVFAKFCFLERFFADRAVNVALLVGTVLDFTGFLFADSFGNVHCDGAEFRVWHQAAGAEQFTETTDNAHHVGRGNRYVEIEPAALNLRNQIIGADIIRAGRFSFLSFFARHECQNFFRLADTVRQDNRAANLLVGIFRVNAKANMHFDCFVEFRRGGFLHELNGFVGGVKFPVFDKSQSFAETFALLCH